MITNIILITNEQTVFGQNESVNKFCQLVDLIDIYPASSLICDVTQGQVYCEETKLVHLGQKLPSPCNCQLHCHRYVY